MSLPGLLFLVFLPAVASAEEFPIDHPQSSVSCLRCHAAGIPAADYLKPECAECHLGTISAEAAVNKPAAPANPDEKIIEQEMVRIPAGAFTMGHDDGRPLPEGEGDPDENPAHRVMVEEFFIDRYETTNAMYKRFLDATRRTPPIHWRNGAYPPGKGNHPVVYVSWHDADAYCRWAGKRLPTEEEWEKAARGTDGRHFPWGTLFEVKRANTPQYWLSKGIKVSKGDTLPVGSFENGKSPYGLYDMAGNVYEWTSSWYKPYPGNRTFNVHYGEKNRVLRGGSWYDCLSYGCGLSSPSYNRSRFTPEIKNKGFGFRCARSVR